MLLQLPPMSCGCTDEVLESIHKSLSVPPDSIVWEKPHPDPMIADAIESVASGGARALNAIRDTVAHLLDRASEVAKANLLGLDMEKLESDTKKLADKPPRSFTLDDWLTVVDWILSKHLPLGVINSTAEYMVARAAIAAKLEQSSIYAIPTPNFDSLIPITIDGVSKLFPASMPQLRMLEIARTRAADLLTNVGVDTRMRVRRLVMDSLEARIAGADAGRTSSLRQRLFDEFQDLNRDWRRVAITETGNIKNEAVIAAAAIGSQVKRFEAYEGACPFCQKINGMIFTVVNPDKPDKDGWKEVWVGKSNVGRSASPRKRSGDELVEREPSEMWWPAAGTIHPHCRGGWTPLMAPPADPKVAAWLEEMKKKHGLGSYRDAMVKE